MIDHEVFSYEIPSNGYLWMARMIGMPPSIEKKLFSSDSLFGYRNFCNNSIITIIIIVDDNKQEIQYLGEKIKQSQGYPGKGYNLK